MPPDWMSWLKVPPPEDTTYGPPLAMIVPLARPPDCRTSTAPFEIVALIADPVALAARMPLLITSPLATAPEPIIIVPLVFSETPLSVGLPPRKVSVPPLATVVLLMKPPLETTSLPPLDTVTLTTTAPESTSIAAPLRTTMFAPTMPLVWPDETSSVYPDPSR